jgi:hypothetical protein
VRFAAQGVGGWEGVGGGGTKRGTRKPTSLQGGDSSHTVNFIAAQVRAQSHTHLKHQFL